MSMKSDPASSTQPESTAQQGGPSEMKGKVAGISWQTRSKDLLNSSLVAVALIALVIVFTIASPYFFSLLNWYHIFQQVAVVAILTVGQAFVIITAGIDLSQGAVVGLAGIVAGLLMTSGYPVWVAVLAGLGVGLVVGAINGLLITKAGLPPFIATLATLSAAGGFALIITGGQPVFGLPAAFTAFGQNGILGLFPYIAIVAAILAIIFHIVLAYTRFGRFTYAVGSNMAAARLTGLRVNWQLFLIYTLSGVLSAAGGLLLASYVSSALPDAGNNYELNSIAAVVIGGGSLFGGEGTMWGAMIGALLVAVLNNGTQLLGVSTYWQQVILGGVIVLAVYIDRFRRRTGV
jgi:ribose transport system permease protein